MSCDLYSRIISGSIIEAPSGYFWGKRGKDHLEVSLSDQKTVKIAIKIIDKRPKREASKFGLWQKKGRWAYAEIQGQGVLIDRYNAFKHFGRENIDKSEIAKSIIGVCSWELFSNPDFKIENLSNTELEKVRKYILENYSLWGKAKHISPRESGLSRAIDFVDGKVFLLLNRERKGYGDTKFKGGSKNVCDAVCLNDGAIHASASISFGRCKKNSKRAVLPAFLEKNAKEREKMKFFEDDDRFIQMEHLIEYVDKEGNYKARMIMPKYTCDIFTAVLEPSKYGLKRSDRLDLAYQIIDIVRTVHEKGWLLKDLKLENFLIKKEEDRWKVVCCDLDMFCRKDDLNACKMIEGTSHYFSPEFFRGTFNNSQKATEKHDIWALGHALADLFDLHTKERCEIYDHKDFEAKRAYVKGLKKDWIKEPENQNGIEYLVWQMLQPNPKNRISSKRCLEFVEQICDYPRNGS